jgi:hypothetical protein
MPDMGKSTRLSATTNLLARKAGLARKPKINPRLKIRSYKTLPNQSISISSGAVILSIGLAFGLSIPAFRFESVLGFSKYDNEIESTRGYDGLAILLFQFTFGLIFSYTEVVPLIVAGWLIGGIVASMIFAEDGRRGPYYSAILAISVTMALAFLLGVITLTLNDGVPDFDLIFLPLLAALVVSLILSIFSVPLILIAMIGYRLGGWLSNVK